MSVPDAAPISPTLLLRIYRVAVRTRAVDQQLWLLARQGRAGFVLTARGHEVAQIASVAAMRRGHDSAWPYYRDMGVGLALGVTPYEILLGALARAADPHSGGRQLTMHLSSPSLRIGSVSSAIAAQLPHAVGAAYAARVRGEDSVAVTWFGDGATSEGATHEAMNLAAVHRLPVVFLCENNGLAISVPQALQMPLERVSDRAAAYGMPGITVDGTDAEAVHHAARTAIERARGGEGPSLVEMLVPRITPHSSQDDDLYRDEEQRAAATAADPLPRLRDTLVERGLLSLDEDDRMVREAREQVVADEDLALAMPQPAPERARRWLFAGDPPHGGVAQPARYASWMGVFGD
ncbi:MAG TPA: thiamine pyrophosphate-dependent dehydrogenase E1 component subunit alpha [Candidatus Dormibacteraeota bacterium]|nr:thiamine pyrophosphate-dependent dehydrogenase E1 component subunit alpha [Candidatus Dormibacteraeota bacterium]